MKTDQQTGGIIGGRQDETSASLGVCGKNQWIQQNELVVVVNSTIRTSERKIEMMYRFMNLAIEGVSEQIFI